MDTNILLESGTNELEILEFTLGDNHYGINVAKIREIFVIPVRLLLYRIHNPSVEGIFYAARGDDYGHQSEKVSWHGG